MSTVPALAAGGIVTTALVPSLETLTTVAGVVPKLTEVEPFEKSIPVKVTVAPAAGVVCEEATDRFVISGM
jgi:hypothetical protein